MGRWTHVCASSFSSSDVLPDAEGHDDYEEESFDYSERENLASNNSATTQDLAKLAKMSYYNYTKVAARYSTA